MCVQLRRDVHRFNPAFFGTLDDFLDARPHGRDTLMFACCDHGTAPDQVSFASPGRFYVLQNLGASVPSAHDIQANHSACTQLEFAFCTERNLKHVIVCGHLHCRVISHWLTPRAVQLRSQPLFQSRSLAAVDAAYPNLTHSQRASVLIHEHVLIQLENLQSHDFIRSRLDAADLHLHGWVVDDASARVQCYNPRLGQFVPIEQMRFAV